MCDEQQDFALLNVSCPRDVMRFCLVYRGPLSSTQTKKAKRRPERMEIRKQIAPQMKRLWETSQALAKLQWDAQVPGKGSRTLVERHDSPVFYQDRGAPAAPSEAGFIDLSGPIEFKGKSFRPLIRKSLDLTCSLDILFLRQEAPGSLLKKAGDIDNRIKTFIDALEMPQEELEGDESDGINYPLLENDTLVRGLEINTERLLLPEDDFPNQVHLVVEVTVHIEMVGRWNLCLL